LLTLEQFSQFDRVNARHRDVRANPEHQQGAEQKQETLLQVSVFPAFT
jgi:hypothetical protein